MPTSGDAADKDLQQKVRDSMDDGIEVQACLVCADSYAVTETLQSEYQVLTF